MSSSSTKDRILDAALASFASRGYEATSLDAVGKGLELTKQSILYWFPSKDALLEAVIARSADDLSLALETALRGAGEGWERVEAVVRSVFRLAVRQSRTERPTSSPRVYRPGPDSTYCPRTTVDPPPVATHVRSLNERETRMTDTQNALFIGGSWVTASSKATIFPSCKFQTWATRACIPFPLARKVPW